MTAKDPRRQGYLSTTKPKAWQLRWLMNLWPPFLASGIRVRHIAADFSAAEVELRVGLLNRNYVGTAFGGSLFAMTDPFHMILTMTQLGPEFLVWDKAGSIRFIKPGRGTLTTRIEIDPNELAELAASARALGKVECQRVATIHDRNGELIAEVTKTLSVRWRNPER